MTHLRFMLFDFLLRNWKHPTYMNWAASFHTASAERCTNDVALPGRISRRSQARNPRRLRTCRASLEITWQKPTLGRGTASRLFLPRCVLPTHWQQSHSPNGDFTRRVLGGYWIDIVCGLRTPVLNQYLARASTMSKRAERKASGPSHAVGARSWWLGGAISSGRGSS